MKKMPRFAVILSGCGRADGSEIHESVCALLAIDEAGCTYQCFAPDIEQAAVINHFNSTKTDEHRNVLVESARIARGDIKDLNALNLDDFDCIVFPGGLGAISNWCDFAEKGISCTVNNTVSHVIETAYKHGVIIGAMCIAPVLIAKVLGKHGIHITIGNDQAVAEKIEQFGAKHIKTSVTDACVDKDNLIVTTPAYMLAQSIKEVYLGAVSMVNEMIKLTK